MINLVLLFGVFSFLMLLIKRNRCIVRCINNKARAHLYFLLHRKVYKYMSLFLNFLI